MPRAGAAQPAVVIRRPRLAWAWILHLEGADLAGGGDICLVDRARRVVQGRRGRLDIRGLYAGDRTRAGGGIRQDREAMTRPDRPRGGRERDDCRAVGTAEWIGRQR